MAAVAKTNRSWTFFLIISGYLIIRFLWALLIPGGSWPMSPVHYLTMVFDVGLLVGLFGFRAQANAVIARDDSRRRLFDVLFAAGMIAGVGLLAIRFTSTAAWWTGHLYQGA